MNEKNKNKIHLYNMYVIQQTNIKKLTMKPRFVIKNTILQFNKVLSYLIGCYKILIKHP